jgi:DNA polymerase-3 subunit delta
MLNFYFGEDSYSLIKKKREIIAEAKKKQASLYVFDYELNLDSLDKINQTLNTGGLFKTQKTVVISDYLSQTYKDEKDKLLGFLKAKIKILKASSDQICFFDRKPDKKTNLYKYLKKNANQALEFKKMTGFSLINSLKQEMKGLDLAVEEKALRELAFIFNDDLWSIITEIKKLASYKKEETIQLEDVKKLVQSDLVNDIFKTIDALSSGNKKLALNLLNNHLNKGENEFYLISMIAFQFKNLLKVKAAQEEGMPYHLIAKNTKLHPFIVKKSYGFLSRFNLERLKLLYKKLADIDYSLKRGKVQAREALNLFFAFS